MSECVKCYDFYDRLLKRDAELQEAREVIEDLVNQFAYDADNPPRLHTGGLSALESAFAFLGWEDPHPVPERGCQMVGCQSMASCGTPTEDGYKWLCSWHYGLLRRNK